MSVRRRPGLNPAAGFLDRAVGSAAGSTVALALLVCGCVFAALAGPAISLHTRSEALHQTLARLAPTTRAVQVSADWSNFTTALQPTANSAGPDLSARMFTEAAREIRGSLVAVPLPLGGGAWAGLGTNPYAVASGAPPRAFMGPAPPKLEVLYRDPLTSNAALVAGSYAAPAEPAGTIAVAATPQTAARFALHPGSRLTLSTAGAAVTLVVTAIVRQKGAGSTFWQQDPVAGVPSVLTPPPGVPPYWIGALLADPGQLAALQNAFAALGLQLQWEFPLAVGGLNADQAQGLSDALHRAATATPALTTMAAAANTLNVSSPLAANLSEFLGTQAGIETVLLLLFVGLIVTGAAAILLAARMIVLRRDDELGMLRARGGSLRQVAAVMGRGALVATLPAAAIGAGLAIVVIPGWAASSSLGWVLAGAAVAVALAGPPLVAAWQHRKPAPAVNPVRIMTAETGPRRRAWRRPVAEVTACAAAVAALVVLHGQGQPAGGQVNLLVAAAPVLVAIPVVVVMLRLYPLAIRGLFALSAHGGGATGFVALSRAARSSLTGVLPAFALVLVLTLAAFAGMVGDGITQGETTASWDTTGADVAIQPAPTSPAITPTTVKAIAAVRGVRHVTAVLNSTWVTPFGQAVNVAAVDPASYAAVTASTPFPSFSLAKIGPVSSSAHSVPVLASPAAAAILGRGTAQLTTLGAVAPLAVRVAGMLDSTPAQPGGGAFAVMALQDLSGPFGLPAPNLILLSGSAIDRTRLAAVVASRITGSTITYRASVLASLAGSPLQHGAALIVVLTLAEAAVLGLFIVLLGLALGAAERELTLARLTVMGHERDTRLVMAEAMPAVITAVVAGGVCALALPHLIGSSIDFSAFAGTSVPVHFEPDVTALGLPAAAIVLLAVAVLAAEARTLRRRGIAGILRAN
jgi:putative ABC transport system permease protein